MEAFKKYFKFPLIQDEYAPFIVWDSDDNRAFDFVAGSESDQKRMLKILNGNESGGIVGEFTHEGGVVSLEGSKLLRIRSWGRLTGTGGGLGLDTEKAAHIQDEFCDWIIETLKNKS